MTVVLHAFLVPAGVQKRELSPLELEKQTAVHCHVDDGSQTWVFRKSNDCSSLLSHLFSIASCVLMVLVFVTHVIFNLCTINQRKKNND